MSWKAGDGRDKKGAGKSVHVHLIFILCETGDKNNVSTSRSLFGAAMFFLKLRVKNWEQFTRQPDK